VFQEIEQSVIVESIVEQIAKTYQPQKIILFGSYARGTQNSDSDIDLLIIKDTPEDFFTRIRNVRQNLFCPLPLDILVYTTDEINKLKDRWFINDIMKEGVVVYEQR
jgi:predicted nucleotidyltransferase